MVKPRDDDWTDDFPMRDEVEDFAGTPRTFLITCHEGGLGFTVRAREETKRRGGYEFAAYSETSPYAALGRLRHKMHRGLATRHLTRTNKGPRMLHDELRGRITWSEEEGVAVVVDGELLGIDSLAEILAGHEGWEFELTIRDSLE